MQHVAIISEEINHHPEWRNVYNNIDIELSTHDCSGLSEKDFILARFINNLYKNKTFENVNLDTREQLDRFNE